MAEQLFEPDILDVERAMYKFGGNIAKISEFFKVSRQTMYMYLKRHPDAKIIRKKVFDYNAECLLDQCEVCYNYALQNFKTDIRAALVAANKIIDSIGQSRGYGVVRTENEDKKHVLTNEDEYLKAKYELIKLNMQLEKYRERFGSIQ